MALMRQWLIIKTLSMRRHGVTVRELAEEHGVSEKTIRRDLETLMQVGFPLESDIKAHGQKSWRMGPTKQEISFAFDEALALYLGRRLLEPLAGTLLWEAAQNAFRKVRAAMGTQALRYLEKMADHLYHPPWGCGNYAKKAEIIDHLMIAIEDRHAVLMLYHSLQATEPVQYEIHPYGLVYHLGSLYLVAFSRDHDEIRHFKVDRMEAAEVTEFPFHMPEGFDLKEHLADAFGVYRGDGDVLIRVWFSPTVARYVEESQWHESQKLTRQRDQSLLAEFRLSDTKAIKQWLLSFGCHAEVLEPAEFRADMQRELTDMLRRYGMAAPGEPSDAATQQGPA